MTEQWRPDSIGKALAGYQPQIDEVVPEAFRPVYERAIRLPAYEKVIASWWAAMACFDSKHSPFDEDTWDWQKDRILARYKREGPDAFAPGELVKYIRLARVAGDEQFVKKLKNLQRNRARYADDFALRLLVIGAWLPFLLWLMDDANASAVLGSLPRSKEDPLLQKQFCTKDAYKKARQSLKLVWWKTLGFRVPPIRDVSFDRSEPFRFASRLDVPNGYVGD